VLHGGSGKDWIYGGLGDDVIYGGDGNDRLSAAIYKHDLGADKLYCGPGIDHYFAHKLDYVDSSCEKKVKPVRAVGGLA
jgi:Ca2+-binding RTX toxin-like protein